MFLSSFFFLLSSNSFNFASLLCIIVSRRYVSCVNTAVFALRRGRRCQTEEFAYMPYAVCRPSAVRSYNP